MVARSLALPLVMLGIAVALAACGGTATPSPTGGGGGTSPAAASVAPSAPPAASGATGFEGSFTTSGLYSATWTVAKDAEPAPFNASGNVTLASDKNTFGNIAVKPDGSVSFGSAAAEFGKDLSFEGTGAKVTLNSGGQFVCAFTIDADLKGHADGAVLHLTGSMTAHWHPGFEDLDCP